MPRVIRRHGAYVALSMTSLALAVGATLAVFTVVNALWLRPVPFADPDRLVMLMSDGAGSDESMWFVGLEVPGRWTAFEAVAGQVVTSGTLSSLLPHVLFEQVGHDVETLGVTSQYFRLFGQSIRGRDFTRDDNRYGAEPVAIISDRLWLRAFARRPDAIGALAAAKPFPIRIIGVAPPGFEGARRGEHADIWIPSNLVPRVAPGASDIPEDGPAIVFARLHPGQTATEAERRLVQEAVGEFDRRVKELVRVVPLRNVFGTPNSRTIVIREQRAGRVVAGLAGLVLLAGCATLMALVLVHYERRRRELGVRLALGASRSRLGSELAGELAWVAAGGTAGAMLVAVWSLRTLPALSLPGGVDLGRLDLSIDWRVVAAGLATTVLTLVAAALVPLTRFTRANLARELIATSSTTSASSQRLRQTLLGLHVLATIVVLVAAGLFVRAVLYGFSAGPGFDIDHTAYVRVQVVPPFMSSGTDDDRLAVITKNTQRLKDGLHSLPGVDEVAMGPSPIGPDHVRVLLAPRTVETRGERRELRVGILTGSPELLPSLGVTIVQGRALTAADDSTSPRPALVTASLARTLWPVDEPVGRVFSFAGPRRSTYTVVGISADFVYGSLSQASNGVGVTVRPRSLRGMQPQFVVRTGRPELLVEPIRKLVKDVVPDAPRLVVETGREIVARDLGPQRLGAWFFSGFGLVALVLGAGGVFGLVAYLAESRRREFGVRLALGATPGDLVWRGVGAGLMPVSIGATAGLLVAALVARLFVAVLPGLSALDPLTYASVALLMVGCAAVAGLAAAWRLRHIAPGDALRAE
jgi:putative ABC transport system permease protein